jgi:hypothetical protein
MEPAHAPEPGALVRFVVLRVHKEREGDFEYFGDFA